MLGIVKKSIKVTTAVRLNPVYGEVYTMGLDKKPPDNDEK
jgi:hypothetical protein